MLGGVPSRDAPLVVSCPRSSLPLAAVGGHKQATEIKMLVSRPLPCEMRKNFGVGTLAMLELWGWCSGGLLVVHLSLQVMRRWRLWFGGAVLHRATGRGPLYRLLPRMSPRQVEGG
jgi:hypothetical protein